METTKDSSLQKAIAASLSGDAPYFSGEEESKTTKPPKTVEVSSSIHKMIRRASSFATMVG